MDFGGLDRLLCSDNNNNPLISAYDLDPKPKPSGFKHEQSLSVSVSASTTPQIPDQWRDMKVPKLTTPLYSDSQNMLSFASPTTPALPYYSRNSNGYGMRGVLAGVRGPFTPSQWMELEHQALIYKYITVNAPVPSNLLIPIRKALETAAFCSYPGTNLRHAAYGWGGFHMGFSNSSDPEPGRCRRTDGKKWRCSRDAVADQKYCERHMNRGRHRSRKPVEGQAGHSVTTPTTQEAVVPSASTSILSHLNQQTQHQINSLLNKGNMVRSDKVQGSTGHTVLSPSSIGVKRPISVPSEFGFVCSDSLLNPLRKNENVGQKSPNSLHQFMDDWPHPDKTQLSISIPMSSSDFMSSNSSPIHERLNLSPLRMGLGVGNTTAHKVLDEMSQPSWIPASWDASSGGPLGEVLNHSTNSNSPTEGWESSQQMTLSPTGVLQKTGFGCFSNSSAGSSPRTDNSLLGSTLVTSSLPLL